MPAPGLTHSSPRLTIVIEHALTRPWNDTGPWSARLSAGFVRRGWAVRVLADTALDQRPYQDAGVEVVLRRPAGTFVSARPLSYRAWLRGRIRDDRSGPVLSLTRIWAGDVWLPLGLSAREQFDLVRSGRSPLAAPRLALHTPRLLQTVSAERAAAADARRAGTPPLRLGGPGVSPERVMTATGLDQPTPERVLHHRERVRRRLGLGAAPVALASAAHLAQPGWDAMLAGLAAGPDGIRLLVSGGSPHAVAMRARRAGVGGRVVPLSGLDPARVGEVIAAADAVVLPAHHADRHGSGRLAADGLRVGRPVLAAEGAPGAGLVEPRGFGTPAVGVIVSPPTAERWRAAFGVLSDPGRLAGMTDAARSVGAGLGMDGLIERLALRLSPWVRG